MGGVLCIAVPQSSVAMIERFGKFDREAEAGCHPLCCICGEASAGLVSLRLQQVGHVLPLFLQLKCVPAC